MVGWSKRMAAPKLIAAGRLLARHLAVDSAKRPKIVP
jgi:hypothetical protein